MEITELARELGKKIQSDKRYEDYQREKKNCDEDTELQNLISEFNLKRMSYEYSQKNGTDDEKIKKTEEEINQLYSQITSSQTMIDYNKAKTEMDGLMNGIYSILNQCAQGFDPDTVQIQVQCGGDCSSCGGCH
jgi:cell fate (sporulation/competence/biofilm development) regulator YlbF (YheA/YmcA/DUF963 family)